MNLDDLINEMSKSNIPSVRLLGKLGQEENERRRVLGELSIDKMSKELEDK